MRISDWISDVCSSDLAARLRLRPILLTSFVFIGGILPLAVSSGAGAGGQNAIGISGAGGMFAATILAIMFVTPFFVIINRLTCSDKRETYQATEALAPAE